MKNLFKKLTSVALFIGLILFSLIAFKPRPAEAQVMHPSGRPSGGLRVPVQVANPTTPTTPSPTAPTPQPNFWAPGIPRPYNQQTENQALRQVRADDSRQCLAENSSGGGGGGGGGIIPSIGQAVVTPIADAVREAVTLEAIPDALDSVFTGANASIQREFRTAFNQNVITGLKNIFPENLRRNLLDFTGENPTIDLQNPANRGQFRELINLSIRESLPQVFCINRRPGQEATTCEPNQDLFDRSISSAISDGLQNTVGDALTVSLKKIARDTIDAQYRAQITGMVGAFPDIIQQQIEDIQATIQGTIDATRSVIQGIGTCAADFWCFGSRIISMFAGLQFGQTPQEVIDNLPEVKQMNAIIDNFNTQMETTTQVIAWVMSFATTTPEGTAKREQLVNDMVDNLTLTLEASLTSPRSIERLGDQIVEAMENPLNNSMNEALADISHSLTGPISAVEDAIDNIDNAFLNPIIDAADFQVSAMVGAVNRTTDSIIDSASANITAVIDDKIGKNLLYPLAININNTASNAGNWIAGGINSVGADVQNFFYPPMQVELVSDTAYAAQNGILQPNQMLESDYERARAVGGFVELMPNGTPSATAGTPQVTLANYEGNLAAIDQLDVESGITPLNNATTELSTTAGAQTVANTDGAIQAAMDKTVPETLPATIGATTGKALTAGAIGTINAAGSAISGVVSSMLSKGHPIVAWAAGGATNYLVNRLTSWATTAITKAVGTAAGGAGNAVISVPVSDMALLAINTTTDLTTSQILGTSNTIKDMTEKILQLQTQSCTHLKTIQRIQLALEAKELYGDRKAREAAAITIKNYYDQRVLFIAQGRDMGNDEKGSFYSSNPDAREDEEDRRIAAIVLAEAKDGTGFFEKIKPTLSEETYNNITTGSGETTTGWSWETWNELIQPRNNPLGSAFLTITELNDQQAKAKKNLREEIVAGQGFEGVKVCVENEMKTGPDGKEYCAKYKVVTPGVLLKEEITALVTSIIRQMENVQELGSDPNKNDAAIQSQKLENFIADPDGSPAAQWSALNCPVPGACPPAPDASAFSN